MIRFLIACVSLTKLRIIFFLIKIQALFDLLIVYV